MLTALKNWGELYEQEIKLYENTSADHVIVIELDSQGNYIGVSIEDFTREKLDKYLYRKAQGSNPPTETPTLSLNNKRIEKSIGNLIKANANLRKFGKIPEINIEQNKVKEEIQKFINPKEKYILTVRFGGKYIGEMEEYINALEESIKSEYRTEFICGICGERKSVSYRIPFKFLTYDKPGYFVGWFERKTKNEFYSNCPICFDCYEKMRIARRKLEELKFNLAGVEYLFIPETLKKDTLLKVKGLLHSLEEFWLKQIDIAELEHELKSLAEEGLFLSLSHLLDESEISGNKGLDFLSVFRKLNDIVWGHFLFIKREQNRESIELYISDVFPSRIDQLFRIKEYIEKLDLVKDFDYGKVKEFFESEEDFYVVVDATFRGAKIADTYIFRVLMEKLRQYVLELESRVIPEDSQIMKAMAVYLFIKLSTEGLKMDEIKKLEDLQEMLKWIESLPTVKNEDWKVALTLLGCLVEHLMEEQRRQRGSKPFLKKLKSLKMRWEDFLGLLPELRQKLEEYEIYDYKSVKTLYDEVSERLLKAEKPKTAIDELNFYFVVGMGIYGKFKDLFFRKNKIKNKDEEAQS